MTFKKYIDCEQKILICVQEILIYAYEKLVHAHEKLVCAHRYKLSMLLDSHISKTFYLLPNTKYRAL